MRTINIARIIGLIGILNGVLLADEGERLPNLKNMYLMTPIVQEGRAAVVIVSPTQPEYMQTAELIQRRIAEQTGVKLEIKPDDEESEEYLAQQNVILIGNLMTGKLATRLYCMHFLDVDAAWPGKGGYLLQTIHNPFGNEHNVISIGSSDSAGFAECANVLLKKTGNEKTIILPPIYELKTQQQPPFEITPKIFEELTADLVGEGKTHAIGDLITQAGWKFTKWRMPGYAKLFKRGVELLWKDLDRLDVYDDMRTIRYFPMIWDQIEESECFSDADRKYISDCLYVYAQKGVYAKEPLKHGELGPSKEPHGNNWDAEATYMAGMYLSKYYPELPLGKRLMEQMDNHYCGDMNHWKVAESAPGYGDITWDGNINYALTRPCMMYFETGKVRKAADYAIIITDNRGNASGFGDDIGNPHAVGRLPVAAWYYHDGGYMWWYRHIGGEPNRFMVDFPETPPERLMGIKYAPLDKWVYDRTDRNYDGRGKRDFPIEECFDKMSFRAGFEKTNQYLCLSGVSYGFHSHPDGNAIVNFSRNDKQFLYDNGYQIAEVTEHNTVIVYRNGLSTNRPELVRMDHCGDFKQVGITETSLRDYNGVDWHRNIIWKKDRYFVVLDSLAARETTNFGFQCIWRTLGRVKLNGREMRAEQGGDVFRLINLDGAAQGLKECNPKHAQVTRLVQTVSRDLKPGEAYCFANLFFSENNARPENIETRQVGDTAYGIRDGQTYEIVGHGSWSGDKHTAINADAFWLAPGYAAGVGVRTMTIGDMVFKANQVPVDQPVSCEIDLVKGEACFITCVKTDVEFMGEKIVLPAGETRRKFKAWDQDEIARSGATMTRMFHQAKALGVEQKTIENPKASGFNPIWSYNRFDITADYPVRVVSSSVPAMTEAEVGGVFFPGKLEAIVQPNASVIFPEGKEVTITFDLLEPRTIRQISFVAKQLESFAGGCGVKSAQAQLSNDKFDKDIRNFGSMIETNHPNAIVNYTITGQPQSARYVKVTACPMTPGRKVYLDLIAMQGLVSDAPELGKQNKFPSMTVVDLNGDGNDEIVVAGTDQCIYALNSRGELLWKTKLDGFIYQIAGGDLDGDGKGEVVAGCSDMNLYCLDADGKIRWKQPTPIRSYDLPGYRGYMPRRGNPKVVFLDDINGDGKKEIIMGCDSNMRTFCCDGNGKVIWDAWNIFHNPTCGSAYDLTGDGIRDVVMGNDYFSAWVYDGRDGKKIVGGQMDSYGQIPMTWNAGPTAILADALCGDGKADLVLGDRAGRICFKVPWDGKKDRLTETGALITFIRSADIDQDKKKKVIVGSENGYIYVFNADGDMLWCRNLGEIPRDMELMDLNGDGKLEILVGVEDGQLHVLTGKGEELAVFPANGAVRYVKLCARKDQPPLIVLATDGCEVMALVPNVGKKH